MWSACFKSIMRTVLLVNVTMMLLLFSLNRISTISTSGKVQQIVSVAGESVQLPCHVSTSRHDDRPVLVLWYRGQDNSLLYSFDLNEARDGENSLLASDSVEKRAKFLLNPSGSLLLDPVDADDDAEYRCRVDFANGPTRNTYLNLTVLVAPERPSISHNGIVLNSGHLGPIKGHDFVTLVCMSEGGRPAASLSWFAGDQLLDDSYSVERVPRETQHRSGFEQRSMNKVTLAPLSRDRNPLSVSCQAANTASKRPATSQLIISANFGPISVMIEEKSLSALLANRTCTMHSRATGSFPPANITCTLNGRQLNHLRQEFWPETGVTDAYFEFTPTWKDDGGELVCFAANFLLPNSTISDRHTLNVRFAPVVVARLGHALNSDRINEGTDVYFDCLIAANPQHYDVVWFLNNRTMAGRERVGQFSDLVSITGTSLVIRNLTRESAGQYQCQASNTEGRGLSTPASLSVKHAPVCKWGQRRRYSTELMQPVQISCQVTALPSQVNFRWQFNNSVETLDLPSAQVRSSGTISVITHRPRSRSDFGSLRCWADNRVGRMSRPCVFNIAPPDVPEPVQLCEIFNQTSISLEVECRAGDDGGSPQMFHAHVVDAISGRLLRNATSTGTGRKPRFRVQRLAAAGGNQLQLHVFASNSHGRSRPVVIPHLEFVPTQQRVAGAQGEVSPAADLSLTPLYGVFIGVAVSLLAVGAGATVCIRRGSGRKQVTRTDLLSSTSADKNNVKLQSSLMTNAAQERQQQSQQQRLLHQYHYQQQQQQQQLDRLQRQQINPDIIPNLSENDRTGKRGVHGGAVHAYTAASGTVCSVNQNPSMVQNNNILQREGLDLPEPDLHMLNERCVNLDTRQLGHIIAERVTRNAHLLTVVHSPYSADHESVV